MVSLWRLVVQAHNLAGPILMLAYPLYASVNAIESPFKEDDEQWLTYWVLYSFFQLIEIGFDRVLAWIPIWYTVKLALICWLVLPQFHGAAFVYNNFVKKYVPGSNAQSEKLSPQQRQLISQMSPQARASVSAFISEYGTGAFDQVIHTSGKLNRNVQTPSSATRDRKSPPAAQPSSYTGSSRAAQPSSYTGASRAAQPSTQYREAPTVSAKESPASSPGSPGDKLFNDTGSPSSSPRSGHRKADAFRDICRQPVNLLKTSLHSMDNRRREIRSKMKTHAVVE